MGTFSMAVAAAKTRKRLRRVENIVWVPPFLVGPVIRANAVEVHHGSPTLGTSWD
jgi:hypothetical protein